jgi:hypothetical protein
VGEAAALGEKDREKLEVRSQKLEEKNKEKRKKASAPF